MIIHGTKKKRVLHNKGRRSDFLHGYEIVVDPAVLVRVATTEHDRASAIYEDTYQNLMSSRLKSATTSSSASKGIGVKLWIENHRNVWHG